MADRLDPGRAVSPPHLPTLLDCVHCGLCLGSCPTWRVSGREADSPRGRIAAMRGIAEERMPSTPALRRGLENCLICRACESACPSGISIDRLMTGYRGEWRSRRADLPARLERWILEEVIPHPRRLGGAIALLRLVAPLLGLLPMGADLPLRRRLRRPPTLPAEVLPARRPRGTVAILRGCIADRCFRAETLDAAQVLSRNGYRVLLGSAGCCGSLHHHAGLPRQAAALARARAVDLLAGNPVAVIVDGAGCAAALAEPADPGDARLAELAARVTDTLGFLHREGWERPGRPLEGEWRIAPPCHQRHGPLPEAGTRQILGEVLACGYRELPGPELCCGAAGLYLLRRRSLSRSIGEISRERFRESGATGILSGNPGCLLRWESLLGPIPGSEALHPVSALARAYADGSR